MTVELHHGDCLAVMPSLPAQSIDLIACDLPYGTTACRWDVRIPFEPLWAEYRRLLKPRGAVVLTASQPFTSMLVMSNREWFKYCLVWEKNRLTNFFNAKHQPGKSHEDICVFSPAASSYSPAGSMTYHPQMEDGEPWERTSKNTRLGRHTFHQNWKPTKTARDGGRYPRSVLRFACEFDHHPTQKPVALMEYLIRTYSNEGDTVLDNAMGSGTTLVACLNTGRHGIGIEKDAEIFETARKRVDAAQRDHTSRLALA